MRGPQVLETTRRGDAIVEDIRCAGPDGRDVEAYLVRPATEAATAGAGVLLWHWLDDKAPDGNRSQFLDEAAELANAGLVSVLPQGRFRGSMPPTTIERIGAVGRAQVLLQFGDRDYNIAPMTAREFGRAGPRAAASRRTTRAMTCGCPRSGRTSGRSWPRPRDSRRASGRAAGCAGARTGMERETGFEPATCSLEGCRSAN